jgi:hypothetical protein
LNNIPVARRKKTRFERKRVLETGGMNGTRTRDLLRDRQTL